MRCCRLRGGPKSGALRRERNHAIQVPTRVQAHSKEQSPDPPGASTLGHSSEGSLLRVFEEAIHQRPLPSKVEWWLTRSRSSRNSTHDIERLTVHSGE
eukprot:8503403-Pyramimonas_sp.AAC.1